MTIQPFSWIQIIRLGLVQMSIGGIVVLTTSTLNRIMVVELLMPALLPGVLVALHYLIQIYFFRDCICYVKYQTLLCFLMKNDLLKNMKLKKLDSNELLLLNQV